MRRQKTQKHITEATKQNKKHHFAIPVVSPASDSSSTQKSATVKLQIKNGQICFKTHLQRQRHLIDIQTNANASIKQTYQASGSISKQFRRRTPPAARNNTPLFKPCTVTGADLWFQKPSPICQKQDIGFNTVNTCLKHNVFNKKK